MSVVTKVNLLILWQNKNGQPIVDACDVVNNYKTVCYVTSHTSCVKPNDISGQLKPL